MGCGVSTVSASQIQKQISNNTDFKTQKGGYNNLDSTEQQLSNPVNETHMDAITEPQITKDKNNDGETANSSEEPAESKLIENSTNEASMQSAEHKSDVREKQPEKDESDCSPPSQTDQNLLEENEADPANSKKDPEKLTSEQIQEKIENFTTKLQEKIDLIISKPVYGDDGFATFEYRDGILGISKIYYALKGSPRKDIQRYKQRCAQIYLDKNFMEFMSPFIIDTLNERKYMSDEGTTITKFFNCLKNSMSMVLNYSDASQRICERICKIEGYLNCMKSTLEKLKEGHFEREGTTLSPEDALLKSILGTLHNLAMSGLCDDYLREHDFTSVLLLYMDSRLSMCRLSAIATLADIVDEKESGLFQANMSAVKFLIKIFSKALKNEQHKESGWSAWEMGRTVGRLARNDTNKKMLVEKGVLPCLVKLAKSDDLEEERVALESLWVLAFDEDNKVKFLEEEGLMGMVLERYRNSQDKQIRKASQGILWNLRDLLATTEKYCDVVNEIHGASRSPAKLFGKKTKGHLMISYQWGNQDILKKVKDSLKEKGYSVWMDIDNMGGSTLQAMAEAVENSSLVLVCMSRKYKDSPNCRAEAEYAFSQRKLIVPLLMEQGYRPDGWLGIILGAKLFFDFSGKYSYEMKLEGLKREIEQHLSETGREDVVDAGQSQTAVVAQKAPTSFSSPPTRDIDLNSIKQWTTEDVKKWLTKNNLKGTKLEKLTGKEVAFLMTVKHEAPEFFYRTLETKLGLDSLISIVNFKEAIDDIS